jgi:3-deoxy-manno-octulosonate cytidylyltransferase (CMP-KDO synthetase)
MKPVILIPARLKSTRLPNKPLVDVNGKPLIQIVYEEAIKTGYPVFCAIDDLKVKKIIENLGGTAIMTDSDLPSGSDRIYAALKEIDPDGSKYDTIINFQGDSSNVDYKILKELAELLYRSKADIATVAVFMKKKDYKNPAMVKIAMGLREGETEGKALYFSRNRVPFDRDGGIKDIYHHIGIYVYTRQSLEKFVSAPEGILENREKLEQLRALEQGMNIYVKLVKTVKKVEKAPADINTPEELELTRKFIKSVK